MWASRCVGGRRVPCYVFYLVVVLSIFVYGYFIRKSGRPDALEYPLVDSPSVQNLDGWAGTHFLFWAFLGFWFPGHYVQALGFSLAWEGFEDVLGRTRLTVGGSRLQAVGNTDAETHAYAGDVENMKWYGRFTTDTAYNLMGYILGSALAKRAWPAGGCGCPRCRAGAAPPARA